MATRRAPKKRGATTSRKRTSVRRGGFRLPGWLWGLAGVIAGFLLAQHQHGTAPWQAGSDSPLARLMPRVPQAEQPVPRVEPREPRTPTFEFYNLLPEEMVAPQEVASTASPPAPRVEAPAPAESNAGASAPPSEADPIAQVIAANLQEESNAVPAAETSSRQPPASEPVATNTRYALQAGAFHQSRDAERLRERLRNLGLLTQIRLIEHADGQTWHRVMVGPYDDNRELARAEGLLSTQGITAVRRPAAD